MGIFTNELTNLNNMEEKLNYLHKIDRLVDQGYSTNRYFTISNTTEEIKYNYTLLNDLKIKTERDKRFYNLCLRCLRCIGCKYYYH
jgi:hypothetical protein